LKFTKSVKSSICAIAITAALAIPTASSALAVPTAANAVPASVSAVAGTPFNVIGAIGGKWYAIGGANSRMGKPVGNEFGGLRNNGAAQYFQGGAIVWSPATGAMLSVGAIRHVWLSTGATNGKLGYPKTDEYPISGGVRQDYEGGFITWDSTTGRTAIGSSPSTPAPAAPVSGVDNSPAGAKAFAKSHIRSLGWGESEYQCLVHLWDHESEWKFTADNPWSDAFGIPQALPGNRMATAGADWKTNSQTQIKWGVDYIKGRYGTACKATDAWHLKGWY
jgi:hypothetical protein